MPTRLRLLRATRQQLMYQCGQWAGIVAMGVIITALSAVATLAGIHIAGRITTR